MIFSDAATTGTAKGIAKTHWLRTVVRCMGKQAFDALYVDVKSRLARDVLELAKLQDRIERSGVRVVSTDGFSTPDAPDGNWRSHV